MAPRCTARRWSSVSLVLRRGVFLAATGAQAVSFKWCGQDAKVKPGETSVFYENSKYIESCCTGSTTTRIAGSNMVPKYRFFGPAHDYLGGFVYWMKYAS